MRLRRAGCIPVLLAALTHSAAATGSAWQIAEGDVRVVCPLTVGGSFEARTTAITGSLTHEPGSGAYAGSLAVDLRALDTGIGLRNTHMRDRYLDVHKGEGYERAMLSDVRLATPDAVVAGGRSAFTASLLLHGVTKPVEGEAQLSRQGANVRVQASFPLDLTDFAIASPRYLGVGVRDRVTVKVAFVATSAS